MTALPVTQPGPDIVAEVHTLRNGRTVTVYRSPYQREGPVRSRPAGQPAVLSYMYAHFVFTWREGTAQVDIGHGTLAHSLSLWCEQTIDGEWSASALVSFGNLWTHRHLARFQTERREVKCHE